MHNHRDPVARLTYVAGLIREALTIADDEQEHMLAARLDETLTCVRDRIARLKNG